MPQSISLPVAILRDYASRHNARVIASPDYKGDDDTRLISPGDLRSEYDGDLIVLYRGKLWVGDIQLLPHFGLAP